MQLPDKKLNFEHQERRVGVEIEFAGLDAQGAAQSVVDVFGGRLEVENPFRVSVHDTTIGTFRVELDANFLQEERYREVLESVGITSTDGLLEDRIESALGKVAATVVPMEICSPPVPLSQLDKVETLREHLHNAGALGTGHSALYAFGMQFNPEVVSLDVNYILHVLQSFLVQFDELCAEARIDLTRRLFPFVRPFEKEFFDFFCNGDYAPDMDDFIDDYLRLNPTRNRPLDLLPLLAYIDENRVMAKASEPQLIKPRPTFHYRLPDCRIDQTEWRIEHEWRRWLRIEQLANDSNRLGEALAARIQSKR